MDFNWNVIEISMGISLTILLNSLNFPIEFHGNLNLISKVFSESSTGFPMDFCWYFIEISNGISLNFQLELNGVTFKFLLNINLFSN